MQWKLGALAVLVMFSSWDAAASCRVHDPELQGSYSGGCNADGWAEGIGMARGVAEYVGEFRAGKKHGRGIKSWAWGDRYVGDFVADYKEGYGMYVFGQQTAWAGDRYTGQYRADRRNGQGIYEWSSGDRYEGVWVNDAMTGPLTAMAIQQGRHLLAVREAVMKVGAGVCRSLPLGLGGKQIVRGVVVAVNVPQDSVAVKIETPPTQPVNGVALKIGESVWDAAVNWEPCARGE